LKPGKTTSVFFLTLTLRIKKNLGSKKSNQIGQSTIEFCLTIVLMIAFLFFYFQLSMILAFGNFVHYATFMSARAYLSSGQDQDDQRSRARDVIVKLLKKSVGQAGVDKFPRIAKGFGQGDPGGLMMDRPSQYQKGDPALSWMEGVRYTFRGKLFLIPLGGFGRGARSAQAEMGQSDPNSLTLTSESWLGREPAADECLGDMGKNGWFFDNGC
jgi:hypothetical protein